LNCQQFNAQATLILGVLYANLKIAFISLKTAVFPIAKGNSLLTAFVILSLKSHLKAHYSRKLTRQGFREKVAFKPHFCFHNK
jgi:hypothetical protein